MGKMDEMILSVDRRYLFEMEALTFQGLLTDDTAIKKLMVKFNECEEVRRGDVEADLTWKQPIPSVILKRGDEVFVYKRLSGGGEERLYDQLSISVGGHMNQVDGARNWETNLMVNIHRELSEEVKISTNGSDGSYAYEIVPELIGLINDDCTDVGLYHIGILYLINLPIDTEVTVLETDQLEGYWLRVKDLTKSPLFESLESWSQFAVEALV